MKTSALLVAAAAALASAQAPPSGTNTVSCAKANASYCLGGSIILRCDENMVGTAGQCSDNLAGYSPQGGAAFCYESSPSAGDAVCEKDCVVYATSSSYTLPASECSGGTVAAPATAVPTFTGVPASPANFTKTVSGEYHPTSLAGVPFGTGSVYPVPVPVGTVGGHSVSPIANSTVGPTGTGSLITKTNTPVAPTTTGAAGASTTQVSTAGAATNRAAGALAVFGIVLAYFI